MKKRIAIAGLAALAAGVALAYPASGGSAGRAAPPPKHLVVEGTLVDTKCYSMNDQNTGEDHVAAGDTIQSCATACAKMGIPVAVLTAKQELYILLAPTPAFEDHMGATIRVVGTKVFGGTAIRPDTVDVRGSDGAWTALDIRSMM